MIIYDNELYHYGVVGMKWGVRRYRNKDGTLTPKGRKKLKVESYIQNHQEDFVLKKRNHCYTLYRHI